MSEILKKKMLTEKYIKENIKYRIIDNKYIFQELEFTEMEDSLDLLKSKFKKFSRIYSWLVRFLSPVFESGEQKRFIANKVDVPY